MTHPKAKEAWTFPIVPRPTNNVRAHWSLKHSERRRWGKAVLAIPPGPWERTWTRPDPLGQGVIDYRALPRKCRLRITVYRWNLQDPDNAVASVKPLVDAIRSRGWAVDDSAKWLELEVLEEIDRKDRRTIVEWELA
jgi:hypothetical protein